MTDEPDEISTKLVPLPKALVPLDIDPELARLIESSGLAPVVQFVQERSGGPVSVNIQVTNIFIDTIDTGDIYMGSKYNISGGQQGAVGDGASVSDLTQNQFVQQPVDVEALAEELGRVAQAARLRATDHEQRIATAHLESAEEEAKKGDGPKALEYLKSAGKWVLEVAEEVGAKVTAEVIKSQLGL